MTKQLTARWSSRWAFILAATGAAVGLGNIWRFPYLAGSNGGSAFLLIYLICIILFGLPILAAEIIIGRHTRNNPVNALQAIATEHNTSQKWQLLGWWGVIGLVLILSFYSVVSGWSIAYFIKSISGNFKNITADQAGQIWGDFLNQPLSLLGWHTVFMTITISIVMRGVNKGLEKTTNFMMPLLYLILISLVIFSCSTGAPKQAMKFLFTFNLHQITPGIIIAALGHAFFTLAVGAGAMLTYGAYAPKNINIMSSILVVAILDVLVAILAGMAIFPIVFAYHLAPTSGPGLMFVTLPVSFAHMHFGSLVSAGFFLLLFFASLTSSINLAEPIVITLQTKLQLPRKTASTIAGGSAWLLGIFSLLSFNIWQNVKFLNQNLFELISNAATDIFLPIGGLGFAIVAGYVLKKKITEEELQSSGKCIYTLWRTLIRYLVPCGIGVIFIHVFL